MDTRDETRYTRKFVHENLLSFLVCFPPTIFTYLKHAKYEQFPRLIQMKQFYVIITDSTCQQETQFLRHKSFQLVGAHHAVNCHLKNFEIVYEWREKQARNNFHCVTITISKPRRMGFVLSLSLFTHSIDINNER